MSRDFTNNGDSNIKMCCSVQYISSPFITPQPASLQSLFLILKIWLPFFEYNIRCLSSSSNNSINNNNTRDNLSRIEKTALMMIAGRKLSTRATFITVVAKGHPSCRLLSPKTKSAKGVMQFILFKRERNGMTNKETV